MLKGNIEKDIREMSLWVDWATVSFSIVTPTRYDMS
jgi:hypothetical protein